MRDTIRESFVENSHSQKMIIFGVPLRKNKIILRLTVSIFIIKFTDRHVCFICSLISL